jgi:hypothetical protein
MDHLLDLFVMLKLMDSQFLHRTKKMKIELSLAYKDAETLPSHPPQELYFRLHLTKHCLEKSHFQTSRTDGSYCGLTWIQIIVDDTHIVTEERSLRFCT